MISLPGTSSSICVCKGTRRRRPSNTKPLRYWERAHRQVAHSREEGSSEEDGDSSSRRHLVEKLERSLYFSSVEKGKASSERLWT